MAYVCYNCGKSTSVGHSQSHRRGIAGKRWMHRVPAVSRLFKPNLQAVTITEKGKKKSVKLCTKCLKRRHLEASKVKV